MKLKNSPMIAVFTLLAGASYVTAEDNKLIFPPAEGIPNVAYPPLVQMNPIAGSPYTFGQSTTQMINPQLSMNRFSPTLNPTFRTYAPQRVPSTAFPPVRNGYQYPMNPPRYSNSGFPFSGNNMMPFANNRNNNSFAGNSFWIPNNPMFNGNNNSMPFFGKNNSSIPFVGNNNSNMPFFGNTRKNNRKKAWGTERNIWPDFYTDFTDEAWDTVTSGPRDLGTMPGGWRFPHISTPDPVTVSDAITNQFPPMLEEGGNMMDFSDWGIFD